MTAPAPIPQAFTAAIPAPLAAALARLADPAAVWRAAHDRAVRAIDPDWTLQLEHAGDRLIGRAATGRAAADRADDMTARPATGAPERAAIEGLLRAIVACAGRIVSGTEPATAALVDDGERARLLAFGGGADEGGDAPSIVDRFERIAARHPARIALESHDPADAGAARRWTYAELDRASRRAAARLAAAGVRPGDVVALLLPRTAEAVIALLAVLRAGAAYAPVDPAYPAGRIRFMVGDAAARLLVVAPSTAATGAAAAPADCLLMPLAALLDAPAIGDDAAVPRCGPADLACLMYTSGSTGRPKGARIQHRAVVRLVTGQTYAPLDDGATILQAAPLAFDAATFEIWGALLNGGRCVVHEEAVPTPAGLARTIAAAGVDTAWLTAALFNRVIDTDPQALAGLRTLITGGEALSVAHVRQALAALPDTRLVNGYGPTETTTFAVAGDVRADDLERHPSVPLGRPIAATVVRVVAADGSLVPIGVAGELVIGGPRVADGYHGQPALTAERFVADPAGLGDGRWYRTGDRVRWLDDGRLEYLGRQDGQIKLRGHRIEPGEIESVLLGHPAIGQAAVAVATPPADAGTAGTDPDHRAVGAEARLVAWLAARPGATLPDDASLRAHCRRTLPPVMMPAIFVRCPALPITPNGKLDRRALPSPWAGPPAPVAAETETEAAPSAREAAGPAAPRPAGRRAVEDGVRETLRALLGLPRLGRDDNFFEVGGSSLNAADAIAALNRRFDARLSIADLFGAPTARGLAARLAGADGPVTPRPAVPTAPIGITTAADAATADGATVPIAIIGMAGRFPGAPDVETLWQNLLAGRDGIRRFTADELDPSIPPAVRDDPDYVPARGVLEQVDQFDSAFFGIPPREADLMDPQQRVFLELAWECLERAGHAPGGAGASDGADGPGTGPVGVFAGMYNPTYFLRHVQHHPERIAAVGDFQVMLGNEKDYIATRTAHRLDLRGPAVSVHTACSTSLVAVVQAVTSLRAGQCRMALAGGVAITCPTASGYRHEAGSMLSPDGVTRSFDADAGGTVFSDGAAVVLLKRLPDAIADRDTIHAVIRGVAVNNDGQDKASFTAPSVDGQVAVIRAALADAGVPARSIDYVEAHGTATPMGDPIEVAALTRAWRAETAESGFAGIGSVKSAIGHTVIAAGATGLIKTALALARERIPATLHYRAPNPAIDFAASPFTVVAENRPWPRRDTPRRAAVSAFGVGGTNAHLIVEEAPLEQALVEGPAARADDGAGLPLLLPLSAKTPTALAARRRQLAEHLRQAVAGGRPPALADLAFTLRHGRSPLPERSVAVAGSIDEAIAALDGREAAAMPGGTVRDADPGVVWCFSGQGAQYPGMGRGLYQADAGFRAHLEAVLAAIGPIDAVAAAGHPDLRSAMFDGSAETLARTEITQPALFALQVALARRWQDLGLAPVAVIGHSIGEYAAAVVAGVMPLADAARIVVARGALAQSMPPGRMLSVRLSEQAVRDRLPARLSIAAVNGPQATVVAGPGDAVEALAAELAADGIAARVLATSHAFHSAMMDPAVAPLRAIVAGAALAAPRIPFVSSVTGGLLTDAEATSPDYWSSHLREPVRFAAAARTALEAPGRIALEIGPQAVLTGLLRPILDDRTRRLGERTTAAGSGAAPGASTAPAGDVIATLAASAADEARAFALARGRLWCRGVRLDDAPRDGRRIPLPTYPFERRRHWVDAPAPQAPTLRPAAPAAPSSPLAAPVAATAPAQAMTAVTAVDRTPDLLNRLLTTIDEVCGIAITADDAGRGFVDLGLDSLLLTQLALQIKRRFTVPITFRQLMESLTSPAAVVAWLDRELPADPAPAARAAAAPAAAEAILPPLLPAQTTAPAPLPWPADVAAWTPAVPPAGTALAPADLQALVARQLDLMARQLALLSGAAAAPQPSATAAATPVTSMPASTPTPISAPTSTAAVVAPALPPAPASASVPTSSPAPASPVAESSTAPAADDGRMARYDAGKAFGAIARIYGQSGTKLDPRQEARLDALIRRYVARTPKSRAYTEQHRPHLADPRVVNGFRPRLKEMIYQIVVERSKGSHVWDIDGNEYVDVLSGFGMSLFGWQPDFVVEAVKRTIDSGYEIGPQHPLAGEVARLICEMTGFDRAGLCNTGSEAVMGATRIARTMTGRDRIVVFSGSYHGIFDEVIVRASPSGRSMPAAPGILPDTARNVVVLDYGSDAALDWIRSHGDELAAVLVEPVQSRRPDLQPREFLQTLRQITEAAGTLLIFDEVVTGFRVGPGGAQAHFGVRADLATYGKVVGGGFPIGVIAGRREFMDALDGGAWQYGDASVPTVGVTYFAGTFVRHPLALAAAHAVLTRLKAEGPALQQRVNRTTAALADELNAFCRETGAPVELRHFASVWRIQFTEDHPFQDLLFAMMRSRGIHILDNFPCFMTTAHGDEDVARIKMAFRESIAEMQEAGFLPRPRRGETALDPSRPPVPGARLGRDAAGRAAWFTPDPERPGRYIQLAD